MILFFSQSFARVPNSFLNAVDALGGTPFQKNIIFVLLPSALSDIISGIVLAIGRCAEDTAVIMLTGVVATAGVSKSVFSNFEALPFFIYYIASEYSDPSELMQGYGAAIILLVISAGLFGLAHWIKLQIDRKTRFSYFGILIDLVIPFPI